MKVFVRLCLAFCAIFFLSTARSQARKFSIQPQPQWVTDRKIDYGNKKLDHDAEDGYVDVDYEKQVDLLTQSVFSRKAVRIITDAGVENNSEISVEFDPSYSTLIFHSIKIIRNGQSINKLEPSKIKVLQQEPELSMHVYNGDLSAILFLEDVRKGDIIEYSYTIKGFNPIFNNKFYYEFPTSFSIPIYNLYYKTIVPNGRSILVKNHRIALDPTIENGLTAKTYEWAFRDLPAQHTEDKTPSWYNAYSTIEVSEFRSWEEVGQWALALFNNGVEPSPALRQKIAEFRGLKNNEARILAALRFVQDEIRYMGIEFGVNSHKPNNPNKIFAQRFGDCKDKSYLLCTILKSLGFEANPVLINTTAKKTILELLPSPLQFDHATVQLKLDGRTYWFDPTISYQRGYLGSIYFPDYEYGLVVEPGCKSLTEIPFGESGMVKVKEEFTVGSPEENVRLTVTTEYTGSFADDVRSNFNNSSRHQLQKEFKNFYAGYFEKIEADSLNYTDEEESGIFTTREYYSIPDFWEFEKGKKKVSFRPYVIDGVMRKPKDVKRSMPFSLEFPLKYREDIVVNLPDDWDAETYHHAVSCSGFSQETDVSYTNRRLRLQFEYENLKDHVEPDEASEYFAKFQNVDDNNSYELTQSETPGISLKSNSSKDVTYKSRNGMRESLIGSLILVIVLIVVIWRTQRPRS